jgi:hypothetical protein
MAQADETGFAFGKNWQAFLSTVTEASIAEAEAGLNRAPKASRNPCFGGSRILAGC